MRWMVSVLQIWQEFAGGGGGGGGGRPNREDEASPGNPFPKYAPKPEAVWSEKLPGYPVLMEFCANACVCAEAMSESENEDVTPYCAIWCGIGGGAAWNEPANPEADAEVD